MHADPDDAQLPPSPPSRGLRRTLLWAGTAVLVLLVAVAAYVASVAGSAPGVGELQEARQARPSTLLSADGQVLGTFRREKQARVRLAQVSPHVIDALIATEDHRFRDHSGVDIRRTLSAVLHSAAGDLQGGSTLTQQLARNLFPEEIGRARSLDRKIREIATALRIEQVYTKDEILETYLNTVPFLYNVVGIEMAARTYCDTSAKDLDELQAATLVGMLKGTHYYNPVRHPERAKQRRNVVLGQMARHGYLTADRLADLTKQPLDVTLRHQPENDSIAPHFVAHVRKWLLEWADSQDLDLYADGLVVETTLDAGLQAAANSAVAGQTALLQQVADGEWAQAGLRPASLRRRASEERPAAPFAHFWKTRPDLLATYVRESAPYREAVAAGQAPAAALAAVMADAEAMSTLKRQRTRLEGGLVAMDPATGEVRAWVGSRDFEQDQYDHVAQAARQPGSTFKPFVYGAALEAGIGPNRSYVDGPVEIPLGDGRVWRPTDMSGTSGLAMTLRDGLTFSKNTITAQVMQEVGVDRTVALAKALGVNRSPLDAVPSLALGTSPVTLLEMVDAYAAIARLGVHHPPVLVRRIKDRDGRVLASFGAEARRGMSEDAAVELIDMLRGVVDRGTGTLVRTRFRLSGDLAGKTGTTQNNTDGWFVLMHPQLVAGAWVGFNDARVTLRSNYWGQGGHNAILLVGDFFEAAFKDKALDPKATFPPSRQPKLPAEPTDPNGDGWGDEGGGEPGGDWLDDPGPSRAPPLNAVEAPALSRNDPKTSSELDVLLKFDGAKDLYADR